MNSTEDGVFCFTRDQIQFVPPEDDFTGIVNTGVTCNNGSTKSAIFEDFHDGLSRLIAFAIALQIDGSIIHCTDNIFNVDDLDITYPDDEADFPLTYMFSDCAQDLLATTIDGFINDGNNCLMTGLITDDLFDELVNESLLAGEVIPLEHQCQLAYGPDSQSCEQIDAKTNMTIETTGICGPGVFCMVNGECVNRTIVYSGTPCDTHKICFKGTCSCDFKCGQPPTVPGGYYSLTSSDSISGEAMLTCFDGYTTNSPETITCRSNGWMNPRGGCSLRECDVPEVENGVYVPLIDNTFGNIAILQCNEGFASSSNITSIVCQANGTYSPHMAQCITDCGCPPETENGIYVLDSDSTLLNSTAKLFCCNGTYVRLNSRITCEVDGWMGIANCSENPCPTSDWIQEGFSCYLFDTTNRFFNQSRDFCLETSGANLVKIENMAENDFLDFYATNISRPEPETGFWIGLVQDGPNGTLRWQDGDEVTFEAFQDGQPDDRNFNGTISQQSCTMIWRPFNYSWADIECDVGVPGEPDMRMGFALCEFELDPHIIY